MRTVKFVLIGLAVGIPVEVGALAASFFGTNLFHGGHANGIANVLLPGFPIVEHLSNQVPKFIPVLLLVASLFQFPLYGILAVRDFANKALSRLSIGLLVLHISGSAVAFYAMAQDRAWQADSAKYGACIRENAAAESATQNSSQIIRLVQGIAQSKQQLERLQAEKNNGAVFTPDPEPGLVRNLETQQRELDQRWKAYKDTGGPAGTPDEVSVIPNPCGEPPAKPTLF